MPRYLAGLAVAGPIAGVLAGALLPTGRLGGAVLGLVLLVLVGAQIEPLRADNFDFDLVGPDWLSLLAFTVLAAIRVVAALLVLAALPGYVGAVADSA